MLKQITSIAICCSLVGAVVFANDTDNTEKADVKYFASAKEQVVDSGTSFTVGAESASSNVTDSSEGYKTAVVRLESNNEVTYTINAPKAGGYHLKLDYYIPESYMQELILSIEVNGEYPFYESRNLEFKAAWKDTSQDYVLDESNSEMYPLPERVYKWQTRFANSAAHNSAIPYIYSLKKGENTITIRNNEVPVMLGDISFEGEQSYKNVEQYMNEVSSKSVASGAETIVIEGEKYIEKSDSFIRSQRGSSVNFQPYDTKVVRINALAGSSAAKPNQSTTYEFDVKQEGVYYIAFKYMQQDNKDMPSFKRIYIDGEVANEGLLSYPFGYTKEKTKNEIIGINGDAMGFYLTEGQHSITVESTADLYSESYEGLMEIINDINKIALEIQYITGNKKDKNRDWKIEKYIPDLKQRLERGAETLQRVYKDLGTISTSDNPSMLSDVMVAAQMMNQFSSDLNYFVNNVDRLNSDGSSVSGLISGVLGNILNQPVTIDCIYITPDTKSLPKASVSFWSGISSEINKLMLSYQNDKKSESSDKKTLEVWVNHAVTNVEIMRELTRSDFLKDKDYDVELSLMPDEKKLLLAVSAGNAPDAVIGLSYYRPFQYGLRGALYDLTEFEDFGEMIDDYNPEFFLPFTIGESCYAVPEALNFNLMYYRKDILEQLKLDVPKTWDDVVSMLPTLSQYGMSFASQMATAGSLKSLGTTFPFINQMGGSLYTQDGTRMALGDSKSVEAFELMTDLYTKYSLPSTVANFFNSFTKGATPIGIGDMTTYVLLRHAAPELAGQWGIAPVVGIENEDGTINNNMWAVNTANSIIATTDMPNEAFDYIKWFMSDTVQTNYVNNMQMTFGSEFIWASANLNAFASTTAYPKEHMDIMLEQLSHVAEIPSHPAYVIAERELSDAWNAVVFDGTAPRTALDNAITRSNREIAKKLKEFGYMENTGETIKPYIVPTAETVLNWRK